MQEIECRPPNVLCLSLDLSVLPEEWEAGHDPLAILFQPIKTKGRNGFLTTMGTATLDKPFNEISVTLGRSTTKLTFIQALNRTVLDLGELSEVFRHT